MEPYRYQQVLDDAVRTIRSTCPIVPRLTLVLGSGLSGVADGAEDPTVFETGELPGYPRSTVQGHRGRLVLGNLDGCPVLFVQGRVHAYEGHDLDTVTLPVRLGARLGSTHVLLTNAAGGIRRGFVPGTLMWIVDHIDWVHRAPYREIPGDRPGGWARPEHPPYDLAWQRRAAAIASNLGLRTEEGTYLWTLGPSFETKAEIRAFAGLGADAVGMSTVPEADAAARLGLKVLGLSTITNVAAGISDKPLDHEEVLEAGRSVQDRLTRLVRAIAADLA